VIVVEGPIETLCLRLYPGEIFDINANERHRLIIPEPFVGWEIYGAEPGLLDPSDIVRLDEGWRPGERDLKEILKQAETVQ
jgi:hypothetical protein